MLRQTPFPNSNQMDLGKKGKEEKYWRGYKQKITVEINIEDKSHVQV